VDLLAPSDKNVFCGGIAGIQASESTAVFARFTKALHLHWAIHRLDHR
jgi:hypothetical protein